MNWTDMTELELKDYVNSNGFANFRGTQVFEGIHGQGKDLKELNTIPKELRSFLANHYNKPKIEKVFESKLDPTKKLLYRLSDGEIVEGVLMSYKHGNSLCISTQVGCKMGCKFCVSTINGKVRDLKPFEMLSQVYAVEEKFNLKISNIILMGSGEPFDNYNNVIRFLRVLHEEKGKNMSYRNMTISTCGLVPEILSLAEEDIPVNIAISLHETNQEKRQAFMPIARKYDLKSLFHALKKYQNKTSKRITLEYTLIKGENDLDRNLEELRELTRDLMVIVNLIPLNPTDHFKGKRPDHGHIRLFNEKLNKLGIKATIRRELGSDIEASCGQLKAGYENGIKGVVE